MKQNATKLLLTIIALMMLSVMSYAQGSTKEALPSSKDPVTIEDALTLTLDKLDAADGYIKKLEIEKAVADERLALEKERTKLMQERLDNKDAQLAANEREKQAQLKIDGEKDTIIKKQADRIATLEKKKGGGFLKGFGVGFVAGYVAKIFTP